MLIYFAWCLGLTNYIIWNVIAASFTIFHVESYGKNIEV